MAFVLCISGKKSKSKLLHQIHDPFFIPFIAIATNALFFYRKTLNQINLNFFFYNNFSNNNFQCDCIDINQSQLFILKQRLPYADIKKESTHENYNPVV